MNYYWAQLSHGLRKRVQAKEFKVLMYTENKISRFKLFIVQGKNGRWYVLRKIFEWELGDHLLGDYKHRKISYRPPTLSQVCECLMSRRIDEQQPRYVQLEIVFLQHVPAFSLNHICRDEARAHMLRYRPSLFCLD